MSCCRYGVDSSCLSNLTYAGPFCVINHQTCSYHWPIYIGTGPKFTPNVVPWTVGLSLVENTYLHMNYSAVNITSIEVKISLKLKWKLSQYLYTERHVK